MVKPAREDLGAAARGRACWGSAAAASRRGLCQGHGRSWRARGRLGDSGGGSASPAGRWQGRPPTGSAPRRFLREFQPELARLQAPRVPAGQRSAEKRQGSAALI